MGSTGGNNIKTFETKKRFIELRAQGWSFHRISSTLQTTKPTLIRWERDLRQEIANLRAVELEALQEEYLLYKEGRIRTLGNLVRKIVQELDGRDLSKVPADRLLEMLIRLYPLLRAEFVEPEVRTDEEIEEQKAVAQSLRCSLLSIWQQ